MSLFEILRKTPDHWRPLMGFMDARGDVVIEPQFLQKGAGVSGHFSAAGYAVMQRPNEAHQIIINRQGETVFTFPENHSSLFSIAPDEEGIFSVMHRVDAGNSDLWKVEGRDRVFLGTTRHYAMRLDGSVAFDASFSEACHGRYVFSQGDRISDKKGLMDRDGTVILPAIYEAIYLSSSDPYVTVLRDGHTNVLTLDGVDVFETPFKVRGLTELRHVKDGHWVVPNTATGKADVFNVACAETVGSVPMTYWSPIIPTACPTLSGGVLCIKHPKKGSTYYRPDGRPAMPGILGRPRWFNADMRTGYFYEERASFKLGDVWGYIDLAGKHVIAPQFYSDLPFRDGLARVKYPTDGNSWDRFSYVDRAGSVVWHQED